MQHSKRFGLIVACLMIAGAISGSASLSPANAAARNTSTPALPPSNPTVFPPGASMYGSSYAEWSARWWQWAFSFTADAHPLLETAGCDAGQSGPVWFLGGSFVNTTVVRDCTVPSGKSLLLPVLNTECSTIEPPPFFGSNEAELRDCAVLVMDTAVNMFATVDGVEVQNLDSYRVQSPLYEFSAPDGGLFGGPVSGAQSISDGVWLMLAPLPPGSHTIHFGGTESFGGVTLTLDVTYNITVLPGRSGHAQISSGPGEVQATWGLVKQLYR